MDSWKKVKVPSGCKLFKVHNFTFMVSGVIYLLEVDEFMDGSFTGHGEHSTDKSNVIESVNGKSLEDCLELLINKIKKS
jgi:hypothetical protein